MYREEYKYSEAQLIIAMLNYLKQHYAKTAAENYMDYLMLRNLIDDADKLILKVHTNKHKDIVIKFKNIPNSVKDAIYLNNSLLEEALAYTDLDVLINLVGLIHAEKINNTKINYYIAEQVISHETKLLTNGTK